MLRYFKFKCRTHMKNLYIAHCVITHTSNPKEEVDDKEYDDGDDDYNDYDHIGHDDIGHDQHHQQHLAKNKTCNKFCAQLLSMQDNRWESSLSLAARTTTMTS